jgi:hypothetical protein
MGSASRLAACAIAGVLAAAPASASATGYPGVLENDAAPTVGGDVAVDGSAVASPGEWSGQGPIAYAYQWVACSFSACATIPGATTAAYTPVAADQGTQLAVVVTATNSTVSYTVSSAVSMAVAPSADQVRTAVLAQLIPHDPTLAVAIGVQTKRGYRLAFDAPVTGRLTVDWYQGRHAQIPASGRRPTLVASARAAVRQTGPNAIQIRATPRGHALIKRSRSLALTAVATVTPAQSQAVSVLQGFTLR